MFLPVKHPLLTIDRLQHLLQTPDPQLKLEAVRVVRSQESDAAKSLLMDIANDSSNEPNLRAEAIIGLVGRGSATTDLLQLATDNDGVVRDEALRTLRGTPLTTEQMANLNSLATTAATTDLLEKLLKPSNVAA